MGARMRAYDWASHPLGPPQDWPQSLRTALRILLSSRFAMWMLWGEDLTFFCNDAYKPTLGVKESWALGSRSDDVWSEIWKDVFPRISQVLAEGVATWDEELPLLLERSGYPEETYHTFSYSPLADDAGRITGMLCVVTEETERVLGERRLSTLARLSSDLSAAQSEEDVKRAAEGALAANARDLPFTLTYLFDGDSGSANRAGMTGIADGHVLAPEVIEPGQATYWSTERIWSGEGRLIVPLPEALAAPAGAWEIPPRDAIVVPLAGQAQERPAGFLVAGINPYRPLDQAYADIFDLTAGQISAALAAARAYQAERRRAEALAEIDAAKTQFFSNVSHEFRTPLTLMLGPLEDLLARGEAPPDALTSVDTAHRNGVRLLRLVNTLLDFSRLEAGRVTARFEPTDLSAYVTDLASTFRSATDRAGLALEVNAALLEEPVWIDREMIEKVVLNLLSNAFKFTFEGAIRVAVRPQGSEQVIVEIADTGAGIPEDSLPRLFERFHRVEGARGRSFEGSGIGLALVSELVRLHGGDVRVESKLGEGSRFTVTLRRGIAHLPPDQVVRSASSVAAPTAARVFVEEALRWLPEAETADAPPVAPPNGLSIVLADDNADMRAYVSRLLRNEGYAVRSAQDGDEALALIAAEPPDLVVSDVMMPGLDGFGLISRLRADPALAGLPVILLSARAGEEASVDGLAAGADDYLTKPFAARELLARIAANLALARARRSAGLEAAARAQELQTLLDTAPVAVWFTSDADARVVTSNAFAERLMRMPAGANPSITAPPGEAPTHFRVLVEGRPAEAKDLPLHRAARGESVRNAELEIVFADGERRFLQINAAPLRDADGALRGAIAAGQDVTERRRADEHRTLLINELNHRVKNTLATVQSVAMQTLRGHSGPAFGEAFEERLLALSRAHDVLTRQNWQAANLRQIVERVLEPYGGAQSRIRVEGGDVWLTPKASLAVAMALHELATNAAKYGALSTPEGRVDVRWAPGPDLRLTWTERDGPRVEPPRRSGFGVRLLERGLAGELGGSVRLEFRPEGVSCMIQAPIPHGNPAPMPLEAQLGPEIVPP